MDDKSAIGEAALDELRHGGWCREDGPKLVVYVTIHDLMVKLLLRGVGRHHLW